MDFLKAKKALNKEYIAGWNQSGFDLKKLAVIALLVIGGGLFWLFLSENAGKPEGSEFARVIGLVQDTISKSADIAIHIPENIGIPPQQAQALVYFDPEMKGRWKESAESQVLIFDPDEELDVGKYYSVSLRGRDFEITDEFKVEDDPKVIAVFPADNSEAAENSKITILFNRPMVPLSSLDELEKESIPVKITPSIEGRFKWITTRNLQFIPKTRLARSTHYRIEIKPGFKSVEGLEVPPASYEFRTKPLRYEYASFGDISFDQPIRIVFNQPVDLERTKEKITVQRSGKAVPFVAVYGTRSVYDYKTKKEKTYTDKSIIEIFNAYDQNGRKGLWDFGQGYRFLIKGAYPLEGDIALTKNKTGEIKVLGMISSVTAESARSSYVEKNFFDPQGKLWVEFFEEIDLAKSIIEAKALKDIGYGQKCKDESRGDLGIRYYKEECQKVEDFKKVYITFYPEKLNADELIKLDFKKIVNKQGLILNSKIISVYVKVHPLLKVIKTRPLDKDSNAPLDQLIICTNTPLVPATEKTFSNILRSNMPVGKWNWYSPRKITANYNTVCPIGSFENKLRYGLIPESDYNITLNLEDDFGQRARISLEFRTRKIDSIYRRFLHMQKRYQVSSPARTKLTYGVENLEYVDMHICKVSARTMLVYSQDFPSRKLPPETLNCTEVVTDRINLPRRYWRVNYFQVDLRKYFSDPRGHYVVSFSHPDYKEVVWKWDDAIKNRVQLEGGRIFEHTLLTITDLALQGKNVNWEENMRRSYYKDPNPAITANQLQEKGQGLYWVSYIGSLKPVIGAQVTVYRKGFQPLGTFYTDQQGIARVPAATNIIGAVVSKDGDSAIISESTDRIKWSSYARSADRTYIYTDKPIYRPGQKVFIKGLHRVGYDGDYEFLAGKEIEVKIYDSNYKQVVSKKTKLSSYGTFVLDFQLDLGAPLGTYQIKALAGRGYFDVEEYVPSPFKVEVSTDKKEYIAGDIAKLKIDADYFFGVPVEQGSRVEYSVVAQNYYFDRYKDRYFRFGTPWYFSYNYSYGDSFIARGREVLDSKGEAEVNLSLDLDKLFSRMQDRSKIFVVSVSVKNKNGQTVSAQKSFIVHRGEFYLGVSSDSFYVQNKKPVKVRIKSVDTKGKPIAVENIKVVVEKISWEYFKRQEVDGGYYYRSQEKREKVSEFSVSTDKNGDAGRQVMFDSAGEYEISVQAKDRRGNMVKAGERIYVVGWDTVYVRPTNNETLELAVQKDNVEVGEEAGFVIKSPYKRAKALITLERGRIFYYEVIDIDKNLVPYTFTIKDEYMPNIYASVLLLSSDPEIKYGQVNYKVNTSRRSLSINIKSDKQYYLPGEQVNLDIDVEDWQGRPVEAELSIAVVDLSVLALKGNPKKNPLVFFYGGLPLTVESFSNIKNILQETEIPSGTKGGGAGAAPAELAKKKRGIFRETAFWQGRVKTNSEGKAKISFTLADNLTTWQVESVGITKDTKIGTGYQEFTSRKNLMLVPLKPRFVVPGDEFLIGAKIFNQTPNEQRLSVSFASPTLEILDKGNPSSVQIVIGKEESDTVYFSLRAPEFIERGYHIFTLSAKNNKYEDTVESTIAITPNNTYEATAAAHFTDRSEANEYIYVPKNVISDRGGIKVNVSATLAIFVSDALNYLTAYPYGCSEQIASKLDGLAIVKRGLNLKNFGDKIKLEEIKFEGKRYSIDDAVSLGLARIYENQTINGGFAYYKGMRPDFYLTLHIIKVLSDLDKAGYEIDRKVLERAVAFILSEFYSKPSLWNDNNLSILVSYTLGEVGDSVDLGNFSSAKLSFISKRIDKIISNQKLLNEDLSNMSLAYLAAALSKQNYSQRDVDSVFTVLENRVRIDSRGAFLDADLDSYIYRFYETPIKNTALYLKALAVGQRENPLLDKIIRWIFRSRSKDGAWGSTNNTLAVIEALTEFLEWRKENESDFELNLTLDGQVLDEYDFNPQTILNVYRSEIPMNRLEKGKIHKLIFEKTNRNLLPNTFYYDVSFKYFLPVDQIPPRDEGFSIVRQFYRLDDEDEKEPVNSAKVGEVLRGHLIIMTPEDRNFVAVEDFIPAGMELINFRLATEDQSLRKSNPPSKRFYRYDNNRYKISSVPLRDLGSYGTFYDSLLGAISGVFTPFASSVSRLEDRDFPELPDEFYTKNYTSSYIQTKNITPDKKELHDDRLFLFKERLYKGVYEYDYFARALIPGKFHHLPAVVSEMYFPENFGRTRGEWFEIVK